MSVLTTKKNLPFLQMTGFTLVELLVSITVMAILMALIAPGIKTTLMNGRITALTDSFANALNYARNTAVSQNINVNACPIGAAGSTACGTNWQQGWIIISQPTIGVSVLLQSFLSGPNDPVLSNVNIGGVATNMITFDSRGIATTQAHFKTCDSRGGTYAQSVEVLPTGFIQTSSITGLAVWDGSALTCP